MNLVKTMNIAASGLTAQRVRLQTVASNLANARTTLTADGEGYKRRAPVFEAVSLDPFGDELSRAMSKVEVTEIHEDQDFEKVYDPSHPHADAEGNVYRPKIDVMKEMVDMMSTQRSYEANANVIDVTKDLATRSLDIGR